METDNFLSREQIDGIVEHLTARDLFSFKSAGGEINGNEMAGSVFEHAAERQGHGPLALDRVRPQDAVYLAEKLSGVFTSDGPKDSDTDPSQASPASGA